MEDSDQRPKLKSIKKMEKETQGSGKERRSMIDYDIMLQKMVQRRGKRKKKNDKSEKKIRLYDILVAMTLFHDKTNKHSYNIIGCFIAAQ